MADRTSEYCRAKTLKHRIVCTNINGARTKLTYETMYETVLRQEKLRNQSKEDPKIDQKSKKEGTRGVLEQVFVIR